MLCDQCHWYENEKPFKGCDFCMRLGFPEDVLCSLVRNSCGDDTLLWPDPFKKILGKTIILNKMAYLMMKGLDSKSQKGIYLIGSSHSLIILKTNNQILAIR